MDGNDARKVEGSGGGGGRVEGDRRVYEGERVDEGFGSEACLGVCGKGL